jgi:hypothetical protein
MFCTFPFRLLGCPFLFFLSNAFVHVYSQSSCPVSSLGLPLSSCSMQQLTDDWRFSNFSSWGRIPCTPSCVHRFVSYANDYLSPSVCCLLVISRVNPVNSLTYAIPFKFCVRQIIVTCLHLFPLPQLYALGSATISPQDCFFFPFCLRPVSEADAEGLGTTIWQLFDNFFDNFMTIYFFTFWHNETL